MEVLLDGKPPFLKSYLLRAPILGFSNLYHLLI